jgi:RNA polymerase sporulation-specific sigma factor
MEAAPLASGMSVMRDIRDALEIAGMEGEGVPLPLGPDFAEVVAEVRKFFTVSELAEIAGVKERQIHHWASGTHNPQGDARVRLLGLHQLIGQLQTVLSAERIKVWLWSPHPDLPASPIDCLRHGNGAVVLGAVKELSLREQIGDSELVELAQRGNSSAYDALVRRYRGFVRLKASSYSSLGGEVDDLVQEGLLGLYKAIRDHRTDSESSFRNFAELCITRQIITAVKTATRNNATPDDVLPEPKVHTPASQKIASEELEDLIASLSGVSGVLSDLESRVLSLYLDGFSYETIAEMLECDVETVDNALQRVKRKVGMHLAHSQQST